MLSSDIATFVVALSLARDFEFALQQQQLYQSVALVNVRALKSNPLDILTTAPDPP